MKKESSFFTLLKGIGCFCVVLGIIVILALFLGIYFLNPIVTSVRIPLELPSFEGPTEQDFWTLQEKKLNLNDIDKNKSNTNLELTHGEFNALLSSIRTIAINTFCLHKVRHTYKNKELRYYLIGSGFTLRRFIITFVVANNEKNTFLTEIKVNNWKVPGNSISERFIKNIINEVAQVDKSKVLINIISGNINPSFIE